MGQKIEIVQNMLNTIIQTSQVPTLDLDADIRKLSEVRHAAQKALDAMAREGVRMAPVQEILREIVTVSTPRENLVNLMPEWTLGYVSQCSAKAMLLTKSS